MESDLEIDRRERWFGRRWFRRPWVRGAVGGDEGCVVALASGKGGTGKSFLATNLAVGLHQRGKRVAIVDCDFGLANAHLLLGVDPQYSLQHLLDGVVSVREVLMATPHGPSLVAGGSGIAGLAELDRGRLQVLAAALGWIASCHDYVLLDCAAGLAPQSMITLLAAQHVVMVTNPEIAALTDAYAVIKCLSREAEHPMVHLVVNRTFRPGLGRATFERMAAVARRFVAFPIHYLGEVPEDPAVGHRRLGQPPLLLGLPQCPTATAIRAVIDMLDAQLGACRPATGQPGVEARMLRHIRRW